MKRPLDLATDTATTSPVPTRGPIVDSPPCSPTPVTPQPLSYYSMPESNEVIEVSETCGVLYETLDIVLATCVPITSSKSMIDDDTNNSTNTMMMMTTPADGSYASMPHDVPAKTTPTTGQAISSHPVPAFERRGRFLIWPASFGGNTSDVNHQLTPRRT